MCSGHAAYSAVDFQLVVRCLRERRRPKWDKFGDSWSEPALSLMLDMPLGPRDIAYCMGMANAGCMAAGLKVMFVCGS